MPTDDPPDERHPGDGFPDPVEHGWVEPPPGYRYVWLPAERWRPCAGGACRMRLGRDGWGELCGRRAVMERRMSWHPWSWRQFCARHCFGLVAVDGVVYRPVRVPSDDLRR